MSKYEIYHNPAGLFGASQVIVAKPRKWWFPKKVAVFSYNKWDSPAKALAQAEGWIKEHTQ